MQATTKRLRLRAAAAAASALVIGAPAFAGPPRAPLTNAGPIRADTWRYGTAFQAPAGTPIWNPAKVKMLQGARTIGGTVGSYNLQNYCDVAGRQGDNPSDFTWTEVQHSAMDWNQVWEMWAQPCAFTPTVVPGVRAAYTSVREIQKALDGGAMVLVLPTMDSAEEARQAVEMAYYPPIGKRRYGPGQYQQIYANVPGGYRQTFNDNLVLWVMVETVEGSAVAAQIAAVPGVHGVFGATSDLGNFSGFANGNPDYDRLITNAHDAALGAGKRACSAMAQQNRPGHHFTCFQN